MSKEKVIAVFSVAGFVLAFVATVYELYEFIGLGPVVRRPISANSGVNFNPDFFLFLCSKTFKRQFSIFALEHPAIKLQAKRFELHFLDLLKLSDQKSTFRLTPGLSKLSFERPRPDVSIIFFFL